MVVVVVVPVTVVVVVGSVVGVVVVVVVPETVVADVVVFDSEFRSKGTVDTVFRSLISTSGYCKSGTRTTPFSQL